MRERTFETLDGRKLYYPWAAAQKPSTEWTEHDKHWVTEYGSVFHALQSAEQEVLRLRADKLRLQHENEFMLRLINQREDAA